MEDWRNGGFGIYVHWPFCQSKCPYCDFNSHVAAQIDQARWQKAYERELSRLAERTTGRVVNSIYFGGGTPSLMSAELVGAILDQIGKHWPLANDIEITLEANPGSVEVGRFTGYRAAGVNRVSLGVQALNDADLARLGRMHSAAEAMRALEVAQSVFQRVNFDLIYARQDQTLADWEAELAFALTLAGDHMSLYQLTVEESTVFAERLRRGKLRGLPSEELAADFFDLTQSMTKAAGLAAYEVSNHAQKGMESRHNLIYWRGGDYVGIGPGAHGRVTEAGTRWATEGHRAPGKWLEAVETLANGDSLREAVGPEERAVEYILMGLRLREGLSISRLASMNPSLPTPKAVSELVDMGLVTLSGDRLAVTDAGLLLLNPVIERLTNT